MTDATIEALKKQMIAAAADKEASAFAEKTFQLAQGFRHIMAGCDEAYLIAMVTFVAEEIGRTSRISPTRRQDYIETVIELIRDVFNQARRS